MDVYTCQYDFLDHTKEEQTEYSSRSYLFALALKLLKYHEMRLNFRFLKYIV